MDLTESEIQEVLKRYKRDKEYRRIYYGDKYKKDEKYRLYIRDYNKKRYEDKKFKKNIDNGINTDDANVIRAKGLKKYYDKTDRYETFKTIYPDEDKLITHST